MTFHEKDYFPLLKLIQTKINIRPSLFSLYMANTIYSSAFAEDTYFLSHQCFSNMNVHQVPEN